MKTRAEKNQYAKEWYRRNSARVIARTMAYQKSNPDKQRNWQLKYNFGITAEKYDSMLKEQNNSCAICQSPVPQGAGRFHVDHDHKTGQVRGLLCNNCNLGLGFFADNIDKLTKAAKYLAAF